MSQKNDVRPSILKLGVGIRIDAHTTDWRTWRVTVPSGAHLLVFRWGNSGPELDPQETKYKASRCGDGAIAVASATANSYFRELFERNADTAKAQATDKCG